MGSYADPNTFLCLLCNERCISCTSRSFNNCDLCAIGYYKLGNSCLENCSL